ncbi:MAG TPA: cadherin domain-containing protein [Allosphingosinicella sp.]|nr:cadherin domain-containing protein [Allosphingosinicella sp.]
MGVHLRVYDASGAPVGGDVLVNTGTTGNQADPSIAALAGGGYVVTWTDRPGQGAPWVAKAQIFDSSGARVGGEFLVSGPPAMWGGVVETSVVSLSNGNFAVAWTEGEESGPAHRIQIFSPDGSKVGAQIVAPSNAYMLQVGPYLTALSDGGFAIAWSPNSAPYSDGSDKAVYVQAYDAAGRPNGAPMRVNGQANGDQFDPSVADLGDGRFVVTWTDLNGAGADDDQVMARIFAPEGYVPNQRPVFVSNGGGASASLQIDERQAAVTTVAASDSDGPDPVTYSIAGGANAGLFAIDAATGALRFLAAPDYEAPAEGSGNVYNVVVKASDGDLSSFQTLSITVADVNENVAITSDGGGDSAALAAAENGTAVTVVTAASGVGTITYSIVGGADSAAFTIDSSTGALAFASAPDFEGTADSDHDNVYEVIVRADNGLNSDDQALAIALTNVDDVPYFFDLEEGAVESWVIENRDYVGDMMAFDPDGGPAITYAITGGADAALFVIDPDTGSLSFRADRRPDFEAPADSGADNVYELEITASQGSWSRARSFTVTVENENERPVITSDGGGTSASIDMDEGETAVTTVVAEDDGADAVTYSITGGWAAHLFTIDSATGALSFIAAPDYEAPAEGSGNFYTVQVTASDGELSSFQMVQVMVNNVNEGVTITTGPALSVNEDGAFVATIVATDADGDPLSYAIVGGADASHFTIDPATGDLTLAGSLDFEAPVDADGNNVYEVTVRASDGQLSAERQMSVTVNDVNDTVEIVSYGGADSVSLTISEAGTFRVADVDASLSPFWGTRFTISGGADAALFTVDPYSGELSFAYPFSPDYEAPADADGDNVYDVVVTASTATSSDSQAFAITVADRNEGLWITSNDGGDASLSIDEGGLHVTTVTAFDLDGDAPTYSIAGGPDSALFAIDPVTGVLTFVAGPNYEAPGDSDGNNVYRVTVAASDGEFTALQNLSIAVGNVNEGVTITSNGGGGGASVSVAENGIAVATVAATDADGSAVTYAIAGGADAARFTIDATTGALAFVSAPDFEAPADAGGDNVYDVIVSASDGSFTDTQALAVTVGNVNEGVTITSNGGGAAASASIAENGIAVAIVAATDADGGPVTYAIAGGADAARFTIDATTGALAFVSAPNFEAPADAGGDNVYDVIVSASDGSFTDTQALAITVGNVNEPLVITSNGGGASASVSINENGRSVTTVAAVDPEGAAASYSIVGGSDAARFTINAQTGLLEFVSAPDWETPADADGDNVYNVVVQAREGVNTDLQTLSVTVLNLRDGNNVTGTSGGDSISGTSTNPALRTTNAEDTVSGQGGHDSLFGLGGDDILSGDAGNDVLNGGAGADRLSGGLGKDDFVFSLASESTAAARDVITDFSRAQGDKISLSGIDANSLVSGNQAFTFIGTAAFSNVAGQLRYVASGGVTLVSGDVDGDGLADFQVELTGTLAPIASDFVL